MGFSDQVNFWAHMLDEAMNSKSLYEAKSLLLTKLVEKFGDSFYDRQRSYMPVETDCQFIFNVINNLKFNSSLLKIPIKFISESEMKKMCNNTSWVLAAFIRKIEKKIENGFIRCYSDTDTWKLAIVNYLDGKVTIPFLVSCIAHEMIHEYLLQDGSMLDDIEIAINQFPPLPINDHGHEFMKIMSNLNKDGLTIQPYVPKNTTYDKLNLDAVDAALLNEDQYKSKYESAVVFAKLLMQINPSIVNAIPNNDGSVTVISI